MKVEIDNKNAISTKLKILYGVIILFCIISIIVAIILQFGKDDTGTETPNLPSLNEEQTLQHETGFDNIFENKVNYLENNSYKITKIEEDEEIIYTGYQDNSNKINDYELDVNIPYINIGNNALIDSYNQEIRDVFEAKAKSVLNTQNSSVIYTVNYSAYISNNILSLVIRSTLKEGSNPQRDMVQTYNYDLETQKECTIDELLELKGISKQEANRKIRDKIKEVQESVDELDQLGYTIYQRNPDDDMYSINNVTEYFLGKDNAFYIIYAYGNQNLTDEMDIVVM